MKNATEKNNYIPRDGYIELSTTSGTICKIDPEDYERVKDKYWTVDRTSGGYIVHRYREGGYIKRTSMHRLILGARDDQQVDHLNGDRADNRKCNLRVCTNAQNAQNRKSRCGSTSSYKGVHINKTGKYIAQIRQDGINYYLGTYTDEIDAARAYNRAAVIKFGEYARLNYIPGDMPEDVRRHPKYISDLVKDIDCDRILSRLQYIQEIAATAE